MADRGAVSGLAAEELDDLDRGAEVAKRVDLEDLHGFDALDATVGVFVQQGVKQALDAGARFLHEDVITSIKGDLSRE